MMPGSGSWSDRGVVVAVGELYGGGVEGQPFFGADGGAGGSDVVAVVGDQLRREAVDGVGGLGGAVLVDGGLETAFEVGVDGEGVFGQGAEESGAVQFLGLAGGGQEAAEVVVVEDEDGDVPVVDGFIGVDDDAFEGHVSGLYAEGGPPEGEVFDIDARSADVGGKFDERVGVSGAVGADVGEHADDCRDEEDIP